MTRDIPETVGSQPDHDEDIHGVSSAGVSSAASEHSREGSNISNEGVTGVITRSKKRFLANTAYGKVPGGTGLVTKSKCGSQVTPHSQRKVTGEMGSILQERKIHPDSGNGKSARCKGICETWFQALERWIG